VSTPLETHFEVACWLDREAELLDEQRFDEWLALLTDDVRYILPTTVTLDRGSGAALGAMAHFDEDRYSLGQRVERLLGAHAWTEDPPSRTRRFVTNVRVSEDGSMFSARSYLLLYRSRGDDRPADLVSAERRDLLRRVDGELRLARRDVVVDDAVLRTQNLALFL
jgi:phthalate 3,4-dioxygenase beta subunit